MFREKRIAEGFRILLQNRPDLRKEVQSLSKEDLWDIILKHGDLFDPARPMNLVGDRGTYIEKLKPISLISPFQKARHNLDFYFLGSSTYALMPTTSDSFKFFDRGFKKSEKFCYLDLIEETIGPESRRRFILSAKELLTSRIPQLRVLAKFILNYKFQKFRDFVKKQAALDSRAAFLGEFNYKV